MSLLGKALDVLQEFGEVVGLNWSKGPSLLDKLPNLGILGLAGSPILATAQVTIKGMKATTGSGTPEAGDAFEKSAEMYEEAGRLLIDATPKPEEWDGVASNTYKLKNDEHRRLTFEVAYAEKAMQSHLSGLADHVTGTRQSLDDRVKFMSDWDAATAWMNAVPGGALAKATADLGVASTQLGLANVTMARLVTESVLTSNQIRGQIQAYVDAANHMLVGEPTGVDANNDGKDDGLIPCAEPFGSEREEDKLPSRAEPDTEYKPPEHEGPTVNYPPATPYETPPTP